MSRFRLRIYGLGKVERGFSADGGVYRDEPTISGRGEPDPVREQMVTPSFSEVLRAAPSDGRAFLGEEGIPGQEDSAILSHALWRQKYGGRSGGAGRAKNDDGKPYTVVGVMPEGFTFPDHATKFWVPAALRGPIFKENP